MEKWGARPPVWKYWGGLRPRFWRLCLKGSMYVTVPNFMTIGRAVAEIQYFSVWPPSAILDLLYTCLDHPQRVFGRRCHQTKFGWNWCSSFDNIEILIFCTFGLKCPILTPFTKYGIDLVGESDQITSISMHCVTIVEARILKFDNFWNICDFHMHPCTNWKKIGTWQQNYGHMPSFTLTGMSCCTHQIAFWSVYCVITEWRKLSLSLAIFSNLKFCDGAA